MYEHITYQLIYVGINGSLSYMGIWYPNGVPNMRIPKKVKWLNELDDLGSHDLENLQIAEIGLLKIDKHCNFHGYVSLPESISKPLISSKRADLHPSLVQTAVISPQKHHRSWHRRCQSLGKKGPVTGGNGNKKWRLKQDRGINLHIMDGRNPAPETIGNFECN